VILIYLVLPYFKLRVSTSNGEDVEIKKSQCFGEEYVLNDEPLVTQSITTGSSK
jgi:hypothetical protein